MWFYNKFYIALDNMSLQISKPKFHTEGQVFLYFILAIFILFDEPKPSWYQLYIRLPKTYLIETCIQYNTIGTNDYLHFESVLVGLIINLLLDVESGS